MPIGFLYLVVIIDWYSRFVVAWQLSNTLETTFCLEALEQALAEFGLPRLNQGLNEYTAAETYGIAELPSPAR